MTKIFDVRPFWHVTDLDTESVRGSSERCHGGRRDVGGARRISSSRASQTLHNAGNGDRSGPYGKCRWFGNDGCADRPFDPETGTTTYRPAYSPVAIGAFGGPHRGKAFGPFAGRLRMVGRRSTARYPPRSAHGCGAVFSEARRNRLAKRPSIAKSFGARKRGFLCVLERWARLNCEARTLALSDRLCINTFSTLPVGRVRYGMMLREDGSRWTTGPLPFADDCFFMTTTTANAGGFSAYAFLPPASWPELDVQFVRRPINGRNIR